MCNSDDRNVISLALVTCLEKWNQHTLLLWGRGMYGWIKTPGPRPAALLAGVSIGALAGGTGANAQIFTCPPLPGATVHVVNGACIYEPGLGGSFASAALSSQTLSEVQQSTSGQSMSEALGKIASRREEE